jgi:hypothetical protein
MLYRGTLHTLNPESWIREARRHVSGQGERSNWMVAWLDNSTSSAGLYLNLLSFFFVITLKPRVE